MQSRALVLALCLGAASAFVAPRPARANMVQFSTEEKAEAMDLDLEEMFEIFDEADKTVERQPTMAYTASLALPWAERPKGLDSYKLAGDRGFDPLNLGKNKADLVNYRNAEIKHCRLAMLAAAGWPISELADASLAKTLGLPTELVGDGLAPSALNGGLGVISPAYWAFVLAAAAAVEYKGMNLKSDLPGDFGFDPLGLYPTDPKERALRQESELRHGRTAMVAIVAFAAQEFIGKIPVVRETPFFFEPIWTFATKDLGMFDLSRGFIQY
eukprot:CAMPEP_0172593094 /NCGR_PEP_ID=MMETSP1068-20121228/12283_1 /TAXON_ID=35684 /ORGANISM="Pseudopedinella elastica, Strain CCMP716" /LENGTH=270 /DNA_ID=CAMNT_0013390479 /DNA_START=25 /DNA_END=837 /DNA_ORIENTATION=-